jgi:hypothetical protein
MNGLYPIIRRKRRPLSVPDEPPADVPPIPTKVLADDHQVEPAKTSKPDDAEKPATDAAP